MSTDQYKGMVLGVTAPARKAFAIIPSDTNDLDTVTRSIFVGTEGDIVVIMADDTQSVTFKGVTGLLPLMVKRVLATGTTATGIVGIV